jgi:hypothetical protein
MDLLTVWILRTDVAEAQFTAVEHLSSCLTVDALKRVYIDQHRLELDPALVTRESLPERWTIRARHR